ncbi:sensor histidine kinase [Aureimonas psammosilenae]|uniref:sensor histidine kinase n=1 Tax=Aureimonas psammosilenae TaxID=2495496 RepID=UPI001AEE5CAB|nr:HWE histidine kinase domain-containing protein [Aureimonas psammosilenae]
MESLSREDLEAEVERLQRDAAVAERALRRDAIFESAVDFAIVVTDPFGTITDWNRGAERTMGWAAAEMIGRTADHFFTPDDRAIRRVETEMTLALRDGSAADERWHLRKDGSRFWASGEMMPLRGEDGVHLGFVKILRDRTNQRAAGERLRISEERFRTLLEGVETAFAIVEVRFDADDRPVDYRFLEANPAFERESGVNLRGKWVTEFAPNLEPFWFETYGRVASTGEPANFENYASTFDRWFDVRAIRVGDPSERQIAIFFNDVTERRRLEDQRRDLTHEMAHRMKNVLAMVQSIATQTFRSAGSIEEARDAVSGRIAALARAQDILTSTQWEAAPILDVVQSALAPHRDTGSERFVIRGPKVELTSQQGLGLSLALHELATNAAKYGALTVASGQVSIAWTCTDEGAFDFEWREEGGPPVPERSRTGFGSRLVERLVAAYFNGSTKLMFEPTGVRFVLSGTVVAAKASDPVPAAGENR